MFELILVPVTNDVCSPHSVAHARNLSRLLGSRLILVHVICEPGPTRIEAQVLLERLALGSRFVPNLKLIDGGDINIAARILEVALVENADLIVIGTHEREGAERLMLGPVAQAVAGSARIPVQIIPCHERSSNRFIDRWRRSLGNGVLEQSKNVSIGFVLLEMTRLEMTRLEMTQAEFACSMASFEYIPVLDVRIMRPHVLHDVKILNHKNTAQDDFKLSFHKFDDPSFN